MVIIWSPWAINGSLLGKYLLPPSLFLSDMSPIIGNACQWLTDSLTDSCLANLIDVTLACADAYSKLEVVIVASVGDQDFVGNSLMQIWKLRFGHKS